jgi:hypothetical protein
MQYWYMPLKKNSLFILGVVLFFGLPACKSDKSLTSEGGSFEEMAELPDDFIQFYNEFHLDTAFQLSRIIFPLAGSYFDQDAGMEIDVKYDEEEWIFHHEFDDQNGSFKREFSGFNDIVTEITTDTHGAGFLMVRRFAKINNEWNLIFYKPMGY